MSTRNGKIARLPRPIRDELNRRCDDGQQGKQLVAWLNSLPEVRAALAAEFGGRPVTEQNLSEWKQGGYRDWQKQQEKREWVRQLIENASELAGDAGEFELGNALAVVLTAELGQTAKRLLEETGEPRERWERLQEILRELARLRREDQKAGHLALERQKWARETAGDERRNLTKRSLQPLHDQLIWQHCTALFNQANPASQATAVHHAESLLQTGNPDATGLQPIESE